MELKIEYSVFPGEVLDKIIKKLFNDFETNQDLGSSLEKEELLLIKNNFVEVPLVRIKNDLKIQTKFNTQLDSFFFLINDDKKPIDYFSPGLSEEVGFHNLDVKDNPQSAGLLYYL